LAASLSQTDKARLSTNKSENRVSKIQPNPIYYLFYLQKLSSPEIEKPKILLLAFEKIF